jgi:hypothetical protein
LHSTVSASLDSMGTHKPDDAIRMVMLIALLLLCRSRW